MSQDIHRQAFKEEAYELLAELETSLLEWEAAPGDPELIGRIFRAMHTIKGSGAMFGFDDIARFTHEVETALDKVRNGSLAPSARLLDLTLAARDQIKAMVDADGSEGVVDSARTEELVAGFRDLVQPPKAAAAPVPKPRTEAPPEDESSSGDSAAVTFHIRFRPPRDLFLKGQDPVLLLNELRALGTARVFAHTDRIPPLPEIDPEACYTWWDIYLTTNQGRAAVQDVFIFVEDESDLVIETLEPSADPEPSASAPKLGEILIQRGAVTPQKVQEVLAAQQPLGRMLVQAGVVSPSQVEAALAEQKALRDAQETRKKAEDVRSIRVPSDRLDKLVDLVGEMVTVQARLSQTAAQRRDPALVAIAEEVERLTAELRDNAMSTRMVPIGALFGKFRRLVRDLARDLGRDVDMVTEGEETELDKTVIERLNDPLVHLIRNSIDHGIEPPEIRRAAGKPVRGTLRISAVHSGACVLIRVQDDGAGIDPVRIRAKAVERGLIAPDADLSEKDVLGLIFSPGFSTSEKVTGVSGRGVGMDVVKRNIESLKGSIEIDGRVGLGATITLRLPLTLAIIDGLLVTIGHGFFIIPLAAIEECVELTERDVKNAQGRSTLTVRGALVPYIRLRERFAVNGLRPAIEQVVIGQMEGNRVGLVVDRVIGDHQTVIKNLGPYYRDVKDVSGATILGDGTVALILDVPRLVEAAQTG